MPIVSELREVIGALQSEAEFEAAVSGLGAAGDRPRSHKFLGGCDIKQLPRVEIGLSDDRQQVRTLATSPLSRRSPAPSWRRLAERPRRLSESYRGRCTWGLGRDHS
jgi:hypothetical protein